MDFYENCLQRFVYATGPDKTYLTKNVFTSGHIQTLLARFADAKVIYIARHPYEALPSFVSMFTAMYQLHSPGLSYTAPAYRAWAELGMAFYQRCLLLEEMVADDAQYPDKFVWLDVVTAEPLEIITLRSPTFIEWEAHTPSFDDMRCFTAAA